ncbi:hypothetical protein Tco_0651676 [Tanacetum coccineum]|uniref:Uncharacterized protein n=1 Tax=Tanacetum coccineum TaxID=301880 RepID=A0ABQ4WVH7_9ASTR
MFEKGNYIPWESRFRRFLDIKLEEGDQMWRSIEKGPYVRPMIPNPDKPTEHILEPLSKTTKGNKKQYIADMREQIKRLMFGSDVTNHVKHSRLMDEFDKFTAKEGESLESVYEILTTIVNIMDRNNVHPIPVAINTKFRNCLQPEWSKYVTMVHHNQIGDGHITGIKHLMQELGMMKAIRLFSVLHELSQIQERKMFSVITVMKKTTMLMIVRNQEFMMQNETLEELTVAVIMMARIQSADDNTASEPSYDAKAISEVNASTRVHEQVNRVQCKTIIHTSDDDQIDSNIIFDDPYVENNGGTSEHDSTSHDEYHDIKMMVYNKLSSHDRIVYKMGQSIQTIHMLGKEPNKFYDPFLKARLGYMNPERLKKAIAAQPKMYDGEMLHSTSLKIDSPDSEETLEDAKESRLKMRNKMVKLNYEKLNALYETFVPQQEPSAEQT